MKRIKYRKMLMLAICCVIMNSIYSQTTYTFNDNNSINYLWSNEENWSPSYPGLTIEFGDTVIIEAEAFACSIDVPVVNFGTILNDSYIYMYQFDVDITNNGIIENYNNFVMGNDNTLINNNELINHLIFSGATYSIINNADASITNYDRFFIGTQLTNDGIINNETTGTLFLNGLLLNNNVINNDGIIIGDGTINPNNSINSGVSSQIKPGFDLGTLSIVGNLDLNSTTLISEIDATTPENDVLAVNGHVMLENSNLIVEWINNPSANATYTIMTYISHSGTFSSVTIPPVSGFSFVVNYTDTEIFISVIEDSLGMESFASNENMAFWPNPVKQLLNINTGYNYETSNVQIVNVLGQEVYRNTYKNTSELALNLNLKPGIYMVNVSTQEGTTKTFKIVKVD